MAKDYYNILGVEKNASKDDIKKAFRKMAHQYHPDKNKGDDSKFKEVNEAYQTLSDDAKRSQYDQFGSDFQSGGFNPGAQGFGGFDFNGFQNAQGFDMGDLGEIFSDFFGGGMSRGRAQRGRDISTELTIAFKEAIFGTERTILLTKTSSCNTCSGTGAKSGTSMETCKKCNGKGQIRETKRSILGSFSTARVCEDCQGLGEIPKEKCAECKGKGVLRKEEEVKVGIPAGMNDGEMIRMTGMGEAVKGATTGDLYIKINVMPHQFIRRQGHDLHMEVPVKLSDALLGAEYKVETLDGTLMVKIPEGISPNEILRVKEKGVPQTRGKRGDLMLTVKIKLPNKLSRKAREAVAQLREEGV
jgi:molecular chaperone DnaJ